MLIWGIGGENNKIRNAQLCLFKSMGVGISYLYVEIVLYVV